MGVIMRVIVRRVYTMRMVVVFVAMLMLFMLVVVVVVMVVIMWGRIRLLLLQGDMRLLRERVLFEPV
jgi:hypothetical protein